ncbi:hypothetical protein MUO32_02055 [Shinella sp. CPCC 101442]|uniref:hypothetical protein n=1 Tax=Shinella sp. CPCC 101442 TaxID=2932265 RepID=UPI0021533D1C|nr:hypothetical protein [Shinella sp. CPCC 101442]MCR6497806.1 hypothetical protein [Shinella sp. CPCC 101442]
MLRYGTQKPAGYASSTNERDCRKRTGAGKVASLARGGVDLACPPEDFARRSQTVDKLIVAMVSPGGAGKGNIETRGARAPPVFFA